MAKNTRSGSNKSLAEQGDGYFTAEEAEIIRKQLSDKERQIRAQSEALVEREMEIQKQKAHYEGSTDNMQGLQNILADLHKEMAIFKNLPQELNSLREQIDTMRQHPQPSSQNLNPPIHVTPLAPHNSPTHVERTPIRLKDVADSIPKYDGKRMSVFQFSKICERALDLIPSQQEAYLVQLIMNKLEGHAYTAIEGTNFNKVAQLTRKLKQIFGPNKSLNQYRGELGNAFMKPNENIFDYIARIKELRTAIIDGEFDLRGTLDSWSIDSIDMDVLESFINGLPPDLLVRVKIEGYNDVDDAFLKAIQVSKTLESEALRRKASFPAKTTTPLARQDIPYNQRPPSLYNPNNNSSYQPRSILQRPSSPFIKPLIPGQAGPNTPSSQFCKYCKNTDHVIDNCQRLQYKNSMQFKARQQPEQSSNDNSGNAQRAPVANDVRRDATESTGRQNTVRFQESKEQTQ